MDVGVELLGKSGAEGVAFVCVCEVCGDDLVLDVILRVGGGRGGRG